MKREYLAEKPSHISLAKEHLKGSVHYVRTEGIGRRRFVYDQFNHLVTVLLQIGTEIPFYSLTWTINTLEVNNGM